MKIYNLESKRTGIHRTVNEGAYEAMKKNGQDVDFFLLAIEDVKQPEPKKNIEMKVNKK